MEQTVKRCDMKDTEMCQWYQTRHICNYGNTHGVRTCLYGKLNNGSDIDINDNKETEDE